jgi:hypothetical protein
VFLAFIAIVLLIDILAIVLFLRDALKPATFLIMNCFQTGFWGGVLIMDFVAIGRGASAVGIGFSIFVLYVQCPTRNIAALMLSSLSFFGTFIYSIVQYRRGKAAAQRGQYAPAHNPAAPAPAAYHIPSPYSNAPEYQPNTAYNSHTTPPVEMHNQYPPSYQNGAAGDYYQQQPVKPAHIV